VHSSVAATSIKELVALAKAKPGALNYGSGGTGSSIHLAVELFKQMAGVDITRVSYKGAGPAVNDLLGGQLHLMFATAGSVMRHATTGRLRALAVTTSKRSALLPDVPTLQEAGVNMDVTTWYALWAVKGTSKAVVDRMYQATVKVMALPEVKKVWDSLGATPGGQTPADMEKFVKQEIATWGKVVKASGAKVDN
jgi:tripartite-type tricarboxylate transporter receptor subunit TctC